MERQHKVPYIFTYVNHFYKIQYLVMIDSSDLKEDIDIVKRGMNEFIDKNHPGYILSGIKKLHLSFIYDYNILTEIGRIQ